MPRAATGRTPAVWKVTVQINLICIDPRICGPAVWVRIKDQDHPAAMPLLWMRQQVLPQPLHETRYAALIPVKPSDYQRHIRPVSQHRGPQRPSLA